LKLPINGLPGWHRVVLDTTGSTNAEAMEWFKSGNTGNIWITAEEQTAGKGRRGRDWQSPKGNLYASVLLVDPGPAEAISTLPLLASVALYDATIAAAPELSHSLRIKWPNDLLLDGGKVSGLLLEAAKRDSGEQGVVIGFGVNCASAPEAGLYPAATLSSDRHEVTADSLFQALSVSMQENLRVWDRGTGFETIRLKWLDRAAGLGEPITARFPDHEMTGIFRDLDTDGHLLLELPDGTIDRISAADIFLGNSNPQRA